MSIWKDLFQIGSGKREVKESITPHKISVAIMIRQFCLFKESVKFRIMSPSMKPVHRRDFNILIMKLIQSPDLSLTELRSMLHSGRYVIEVRFLEEFDAALKTLYTVGVSYLLDLAEYISRLTIDSQMNGIWYQINKNSVLGCYLRRLIVFFDKLTFSEVTSVYEEFKAYYKPCEKEIGKRPFFNSAPGADEPIPESSVSQPKTCTEVNQWSRRQAELFIATQAELLSNNEGAAKSPIELSKQIRNLLKSNPDLAEAHFLSYLNYLRVKEFCGAIDSLHHSFDRSAPLVDGKNNTMDEKSKGFRYAALNLAVLHIQFGHEKEALAALKESIMMAQEANDTVCLQHALSWMYKLTNTNDIKKKMLIEHSIEASMEMNLTYIGSLGILSYTQFAGLNYGKPKQIFDNMIQSDLLNSQLSYQDLMSSSYAQKASLWLLYGKTEISSLWSQLLLYLNTDNLTIGNPYNGEGMCQAMCNVALQLLLDGEYTLCHSVLKLARKQFPHEPISKNWILCENIYSFLNALHMGEWTTAEFAASQMAAVDKWESILRMCELHLHQGNYKAAQLCIDEIISENVHKDLTDAKSPITIRIRAMILLAEVHCASVAFNNVPANVIPVLNCALSSANLHHLDYLASIIYLHLANVQLLLGMPSQAMKILNKTLVHVQAHGGRFDRARAMLLYVKCTVSYAGQNPAVDKYKVVLEGTELLTAIKQDFLKLQAYSRVRDVLYLQAQLYNEIQHYEDRNNCALEYRLLLDEYNIKNSRTLYTSV